jgi:hypothetical protein
MFPRALLGTDYLDQESHESAPNGLESQKPTSPLSSVIEFAFSVYFLEAPVDETGVFHPPSHLRQRTQ